MPTNRKVVDFKIHNLTEEQFQELKAQGKIDPNAVYCTPDESLKTDQITNCITEIPQDIKLELADGAIILKAGSKVYVPNGSGNYTETTIENDLSRTVTSGFEGILVYYPEEKRLSSININYCSSGTVLPSAPIGTNHWVHYKTDENKIYYTEDAGENWSRNYSFPLCIFTSEETTIPEEANITKINQVFNGFGYIGSTIFALPGVKGLVPDGRNEDGTLKNIEFATSMVLTATDMSTSTNVLTLNNSNISRITATNYFYDEQKNIIINKYNNAQMLVALYGFNKTDNGVISEFATKTAFHAVDYNDTDFIAHQVMPSNRRIDLTLGASGASYTAPADGWLVLNKLSSGTSYQFVQFYNTKNADRRIGAATTNNAYLCATMPLAKGDRVLVEYSATGATKLFRFIYANGAK